LFAEEVAGFAGVGWALVLILAASAPLTPALSPWRGSRFGWFSKPEFDSIDQVGVSRTSTPVSPLFLREREPILVVFKA
jgi:hypothetical protein